MWPPQAVGLPCVVIDQQQDVFNDLTQPQNSGAPKIVLFCLQDSVFSAEGHFQYPRKSYATRRWSAW
jgi:hypothetical protein